MNTAKNGKRLVVGNWKMNPGTIDEAKKIARATRRVAGTLRRTDVVVCPPFPFMSAVATKKKVSHYSCGAQTVSFEVSGAHTGEVAAGMIRDMGASHVIVGHSETRAAGDSDANVSKRMRAVLDADLTAILCIGERTRDEGGSHFEFVKEQLRNSLVDIPKSKSDHVILAYEPVWAIGAKEAMKPTDIFEMSIFVKKVFADIFGGDSGQKVRVLYGGAVNYTNAADTISVGQVDGLLVGRESVNIPGFKDLLLAVDKAV